MNHNRDEDGWCRNAGCEWNGLGMPWDLLCPMSKPAICPQSKRLDREHAWHFDGDDPYVICSSCSQIQDAISGRIIKPGLGSSPSEPQTGASVTEDTDIAEGESGPETFERSSTDSSETYPTVPMGVSEWRAHGRKYGYYQYFEQQVVEAFAKRLKTRLSTNFRPSVACGSLYDDSNNDWYFYRLAIEDTKVDIDDELSKLRQEKK